MELVLVDNHDSVHHSVVDLKEAFHSHTDNSAVSLEKALVDSSESVVEVQLEFSELRSLVVKIVKGDQEKVGVVLVQNEDDEFSLGDVDCHLAEENDGLFELVVAD